MSTVAVTLPAMCSAGVMLLDPIAQRIQSSGGTSQCEDILSALAPRRRIQEERSTRNQDATRPPAAFASTPLLPDAREGGLDALPRQPSSETSHVGHVTCSTDSSSFSRRQCRLKRFSTAQQARLLTRSMWATAPPREPSLCTSASTAGQGRRKPYPKCCWTAAGHSAMVRPRPACSHARS